MAYMGCTGRLLRKVVTYVVSWPVRELLFTVDDKYKAEVLDFPVFTFSLYLILYRELSGIKDLRMVVYGDVFLEWEEHVISKEKGQRVVHFFLKNFWGEAMLAVVGTERSKNHMVYVFSEDYFHHFSHTTTINPSTKWRTKREVVQWLTFLVTNRHQQLPTSNAMMTSGTQSSVMAALPNWGIHIANEGALPRP